MAESIHNTRVCSVLFVDIVGYSRRTVAEQLELKRGCNDMVVQALGSVAEEDRIILDTGDGAAVTFLGAPENALFVALRARDTAGGISMRFGVNLGPARLVTDLNGQLNVVGDAINVAQRVMSFCDPGQLLVSRSFYEVACRLSTDYVDLFVGLGARLDKNNRKHEIFTTTPDARMRLARAEAEWLQRTTPPHRPRSTPAAPAPVRKAAAAPDEPAKIFDAGKNLIISGHSRETVEKTLAGLGEVRLISPVSQVGDRWVATCEHPEIAVSACKVEVLGYTRIVTGPTREAVTAKVEELVERGAVRIGGVEPAGETWTAVCEMRDRL